MSVSGANAAYAYLHFRALRFSTIVHLRIVFASMERVMDLQPKKRSFHIKAIDGV